MNVEAGTRSLASICFYACREGVVDMKLDLEKRGSLAIHCVVNGPIQTNTYFAVSKGEAAIIDPAWDGEKLAEVCPSAVPMLA